MIKVSSSTVADIEEAIEYSKKDVYCSEELTANAIIGNPWVVSLHGPDNSLGVVAGFDLIHPGVAYGWAVTTQNIHLFPLSYTKKMRVIVDEVMNHFNLHRIQINVKCRSDLVAWAEHLGFKIEGKMNQYGKDRSDYYIMGRVS